MSRDDTRRLLSLRSDTLSREAVALIDRLTRERDEALADLARALDPGECKACGGPLIHHCPADPKHPAWSGAYCGHCGRDEDSDGS